MGNLQRSLLLVIVRRRSSRTGPPAVIAHSPVPVDAPDGSTSDVDADAIIETDAALS